MRGVSLKELAAQNGLQAAAISFALTNPHRPAERAIAKFLGVPLHELWPDRWTADGQRIRPRYAYLYINTDACSVAAWVKKIEQIFMILNLKNWHGKSLSGLEWFE